MNMLKDQTKSEGSRRFKISLNGIPNNRSSLGGAPSILSKFLVLSLSKTFGHFPARVMDVTSSAFPTQMSSCAEPGHEILSVTCSGISSSLTSVYFIFWEVFLWKSALAVGFS